MTQVSRIADVAELEETRLLTKLSRSGIAPICVCPSPRLVPDSLMTERTITARNYDCSQCVSQTECSAIILLDLSFA